MRKKALSTFIALALCCLSFCLPPAPSHACCKGQKVRIESVMPCCVGQAVVTADHQRTASAPPDAIAAPAIFLARFDPRENSATSSLLANEYVADESGRYLELRVLLN